MKLNVIVAIAMAAWNLVLTEGVRLENGIDHVLTTDIGNSLRLDKRRFSKKQKQNCKMVQVCENADNRVELALGSSKSPGKTCQETTSGGCPEVCFETTAEKNDVYDLVKTNEVDTMCMMRRLFKVCACDQGYIRMYNSDRCVKSSDCMVKAPDGDLPLPEVHQLHQKYQKSSSSQDKSLYSDCTKSVGNGCPELCFASKKEKKNVQRSIKSNQMDMMCWLKRLWPVCECKEGEIRMYSSLKCVKKEECAHSVQSSEIPLKEIQYEKEFIQL